MTHTHTYIYGIYMVYMRYFYIYPEILIEISQNFSVLHDVQFFFARTSVAHAVEC